MTRIFQVHSRESEEMIQVSIETMHDSARYGEDQIETACLIAAVLHCCFEGRGKLLLLEAPRS